jgi:hypothetical protein
MTERVRLRDAQLVVWFVLMAATVLTATLGLEQGEPSTVVGVVVILIGCVKLRLVLIHFMELGNAPVGLRLAAEGYSVSVLVALLGLYLLI